MALFVGIEAAEDLIRDATAQQPECFSLGITSSHAAIHVIPTESTDSPLGDRYTMERSVRLSIATAVESVAVVIARPHGYRCRSVPTRECCFGPKAQDAGDLADQLGRCERTTPSQLQQRGTKYTNASGDLTLEIVSSNAQLPRADDELARDVADDAIQSSQTLLKFVENTQVAKTSGSDLKARKQLVQMPAQPVLNARSLEHQVLAMVDEEPYLSSWSVELRDRQVRLAQQGSGNRQRIDRVGLATLSSPATGAGHQVWRNADDRFASSHEVGFEQPRDVTTVLNREPPLWPTCRPPQPMEMALRCGAYRVFGKLPARLVDGHERVRALMRIDADDDHRAPHLRSRCGSTRGHTCIETLCQAPIKSPWWTQRARRTAFQRQATGHAGQRKSEPVRQALPELHTGEEDRRCSEQIALHV
jgi:hypothetical protein